MSRRLLFLVFFPLTFCFFVASANDVHFKHIGPQQGLSQGYVNCILQDHQGFMWFGTQDGLNRYDGYGMKVFRNDPVDSNSLSNNYVYCLCQDNNGILWIGTDGGGMDAYNPQTNRFKHYYHIAKNPNTLSDNDVRAIYQDKQGALWIGTENGLDKLDTKTGHFTHYKANDQDSTSISGNDIRAVYEDKSGMMWIAVYGSGLNSFNPKTGTFHLYQEYDKQGELLYSYTNNVKDILEDENNMLWIATDGGGLECFNPKTKTFVKHLRVDPKSSNSLNDNRVVALGEDKNRMIWIGTHTSGLSEYDQKHDVFHNYKYDEKTSWGLNSNEVECVYFDRQGNLWVGTKSGGVNVHFPVNNDFKSYPPIDDKSGSKVIMSFLIDHEGLLWIGTNGDGVVTLDRKTGTYTHYDKLTSPKDQHTALSLFQDKNGLIYVGTWGYGLNIYNKKTGDVDSYNPSNSILKKGAATITCIIQDKKGNVWLGTYGGGIISYNPQSKTLTQYTINNGMSSNNVYCLYQDKKGLLWIGTEGGGLDIWNPATAKFKVIKKEEKQSGGMISNTINCIYENADGTFWLATPVGLQKYDPVSGKYTAYFKKDGLPNEYVYSILPDKNGDLWLSTNNGLSRFNPRAKNVDGSAFSNYDVNDGLQGKEFNQGAFFESKQGEMFFGGMNGFNSFYPENIKGNQHVPPVYITSYKLFGKEAKTDTSIIYKKYIKLSWKDNFFSFDFVGLDYQMPSKNKYSYKLVGVDDDWSPPSTRRFAGYTQLRGGNYIFRVRACNNDGVWNNEGATLYITITPPFWRTNWFYALCIILAIAAVFGFIKYRTYNVEKEKRVLEAKVQERTKELDEKNRDITSSIQYAKRIQDAILPHEEQILKAFPESFILFKPKDIVSGDFYWFAEKDNKKIIAAVDCTGHGVPGAFMSMIGYNLLNQIVSENGITEPAAILNELNVRIKESLKQEAGGGDTTDGMDAAICAINTKTREVQYAGAYRPLIIVNDKKDIEKIDGNKFPIGGAQLDFKRKFTNHTKFLNKGDCIYLFSDGYVDQFGGEKGKKFMIKRFTGFLAEIYEQNMKEQGSVLNQTIDEWKGDYLQVDDILVIGIRL